VSVKGVQERRDTLKFVAGITGLV